MCEAERRAAIARLNDEFRRTSGGPVMLTDGVCDLPDATKIAILGAVAAYECPDPDGEHHVGTLAVEGHEVIWYIICHQHDRDADADIDPADPDSTGRLLVVMLAGES
jgi:hypothetical protein